MNEKWHTPHVHRQGTIDTRDGLELAWQAWAPAQPRGLVIIVHGLAEHSGRYQQTAICLADRGWAVYAADLRGHGRSPDGHHPGRVHVNEFSDYFLDVQAVIKLALMEQGALPVFLLGHSMGGLITLSFALECPGGLAGAIISSPALGTHPDFQPPRVLKLLVGVLSRIAPRLQVKSQLDTQGISRDPQVVQAYIDDPLVSHTVSARWYSAMLQAMQRVQQQAASLRVPLLLMQSGADRLVDPAAAGRWAAAAPAGLVELVIWEGLYHEMLNEPEKEQVRSRVLDWLERQAAESQQATVE